jgi:Tfp pilus assembly protein PilV
MERLLMRAARPVQRGISLIEALVAMAVMAFGTLAVLGVQTSLRVNADVSRQRAEAVRIAQETLEAARNYDTVATFDALASVEPTAVTVYEEANASYLVEVEVADAQVAEADPRRKTYSVTVSWQDRFGQDQSIQLHSAIQRVPPALAAALVVPADLSPVTTPGGRHVAIPPEAVLAGDGQTSSYTPPGATVSWTFNNVTGFITRSCIADVCTDFNARYLAGFVRFATNIGTTTPDTGHAKVPPGTPVAVDVVVDQTAPAAFAGTQVACFEELTASYVRYHCAVPVGTATNWSGRSRVLLADTATTLTDPSNANFRICRYTTRLGHLTVPTQMTNEEHPRDYVSVRSALINQNFLVIRAGNGVSAFDCPTGDEAIGDPFLSGRTYRHQPGA